MANNMASLLSQPSQATPPDAGPEQSQAGPQQSPGSLQQLMQDNPGAQMQQGAQGQPAPNFDMTVAALKHMQMFERGWAKLLEIEDIGKADIKGPFIEMMADLMGDQIISLPQTLQLMKKFPEDPLGQRQFVQEHYARDKQAQMMLIAQHTNAFPNPNGIRPASQEGGGNHIAMMQQMLHHYKQHGRKNARS